MILSVLRRKALLFLLSLLFPAFVHTSGAAVARSSDKLPAGSRLTKIEVEGDVMGYWNADTVRVQGDIHLQAGQQLDIAPGVVVLFEGFYGFTVEGQLNATATPAQPILFTVADTTGLHDIYSEAGAWKGLFLIGDLTEPESGFSKAAARGADGAKETTAFFAHCHFQYAKAPANAAIRDGGAVFILGSGHFVFTHCRFFRNYSFLSGAGAWFSDSSPTFNHCHFVENYAGHPPGEDEEYGYGGGLCAIDTKGEVEWCVFESNWSSGIGGGLSVDNGDVRIQNNIFRHNDSPLGGGFGILRSNYSTVIANNLVHDNNSEFFGGGMALITFQGIVANNTVTGNFAGYGGGIYCAFESYPQIYNSIIWGNDAYTPVGYQVFIWDSESEPSFFHCNIEGGREAIGSAAFTGDYIACIDEDPLFMMNGPHPYALDLASPGIMSGHPESGQINLPPVDLAGLPRIMNNNIDMGAYEYQDDITAVHDTALSGLLPKVSLTPMPAGPDALVQISLPPSMPAGYIWLSLYDMQGRRLARLLLSSENLPAENNSRQMTVPLRDLYRGSHSGMAILRLETSDVSVSGQVLLRLP